jgi:hypothetical protein
MSAEEKVKSRYPQARCEPFTEKDPVGKVVTNSFMICVPELNRTLGGGGATPQQAWENASRYAEEIGDRLDR